MAICSRCGCEFDVSFAKRSLGQSCGAGTYNDYYPDGDVCQNCATEEVSADYGTGEELLELMDYDWDD